MRSILVLVILVLGAVGLNSALTSSVTSAPQEKPTLVQEGVMTIKQREHSKLYKDYKTGEKLTTRAAEEDVEVKIGTPMGGGIPGATQFDLYEFLRDSACNADAVVIGRIESKSSQLTEDEDFIFTDYELTVEEILKDNPAAPVQLGYNMTITRPGGLIRLNSRNIKATDSSFKPLEIDKRYILFLRFIPTTGAYKALNSKSSFQIRNTKLIKLTNEPLSSELENAHAADFLAQTRAAVAAGCSSK